MPFHIEEENSIDIEFRIAQIDAEFNSMIDTASADTMDGFDENRMQQLLKEKNELQEKLRLIHKEKDSQRITQVRLDSICTVIDGLKNCPIAYNLCSRVTAYSCLVAFICRRVYR